MYHRTTMALSFLGSANSSEAAYQQQLPTRQIWSKSINKLWSTSKSLTFFFPKCIAAKIFFFRFHHYHYCTYKSVVHNVINAIKPHVIGFCHLFWCPFIFSSFSLYQSWKPAVLTNIFVIRRLWYRVLIFPFANPSCKSQFQTINDTSLDEYTGSLYFRNQFQ